MGEHNGYPQHNVFDLSKVALLGGQPEQPVSGAPFVCFVRRLDEGGSFTPSQRQRLPNGQQVAVPGRDQYLDAEDLLDAVRQVVREEIAAALGGLV